MFLAGKRPYYSFVWIWQNVAQSIVIACLWFKCCIRADSGYVRDVRETGARMTRALYLFQRRSTTIVGCVSGHVSSRILRRTVPSSLGRKLETICNPTACFLIRSYSDDRPNFSLDFLRVDTMPEVERTTEDDERCQVEYLETPVKSENDKKEYRWDASSITSVVSIKMDMGKN